MQQYTFVRNFSQFGKLQIFDQIYTKKNTTNKNFEKLNIKIVIGMQQCTPATNFIQFGELQF